MREDTPAGKYPSKMSKKRFDSFPSYLTVCLLGLLVAIVSWLAAQNTPERGNTSRLELLHASISRGIVENGIPLKILEGDVHARQDTLELYCDRAVYNELKRDIFLTGHVKLIQGRDTLMAKRVDYNEATKIAIARNEVRVRRPHQQLDCEYLEYHYQTDQVFARTDVFIHDGENRVFITGQKGEYLPDEGRSYVEQNAHLWRMDSTYTDTLHIYSHRMEYFSVDPKRAIADDSVYFVQGKLKAKCDSAIYLFDTETIYLEVDPEVTQEENEIFGKQIELKLRDMEVDKIMVNQGARAISVLDSVSKKENRLEGRQIIMYIDNRRFRELWAISNARSFYHLKEKEEDRGINVASADTIKLFFKKNELDSISVIGGAQGIYYPEDYKGPVKQE